MTEPKVVWSNPRAQIRRIGTTYAITTEAAPDDSTVLSRDDLKELHLALKRELGLAGG